MAVLVNFENGFINENYFAFKRGSNKVGTIYTTTGIKAFETIKPYVLKKLSKVNEGEMIIAGEAVELNNDGTVQPVSSGTPKYLVITDILTTFDKKKINNTGDCMFSCVADKNNQEIFVIELKANKDLQLVMQTSEDVKEGDKMIFDTDNQTLKKASDSDTPLFEVVYNSKSNNSVIVVLI